MGLGRNLRNLRTAAKETADDVALLIGLSRSELTCIENGTKSVEDGVLRVLASHYGVSIETLISR